MMENNAVSAKGLLVWVICVFFYFYEFLLRTILGTFQYPIMSDLHLTPVKFALLSSTAYLFMYGVMQIPVGVIIDRFGLKKAMLMAALICAIANFGFATTHSYSGALFFRVLMGLGSSFGFISLLVAVYDWMPRWNIALFIGLSQFFGTLGPMLAGGPLNALSEAAIVNWRGIFSLLAILGCVIAFLILLFVNKNSQSAGGFLILSRPAAIINNLKLVVKQPQVWLIAIFGAFVYFSLEYLSENECKNFLISKGFSSNFSSYMITLSWLGFAVGSPILGYLSDQIKRRKPILFFSAMATLLALVGIIYLPLNEALTAFCFLLFGVGVGASSVGIVLMGEQCKGTYLAAGLGLNNAFTMLFVSLVAPLVSNILSSMNELGVYSLINYHHAFLILVLLPLVGVLIAVFGIRETYGKSTKENLILNTKESVSAELV